MTEAGELPKEAALIFALRTLIMNCLHWNKRRDTFNQR